MRADTIELLTTKGRFQTEQAVILAEAIDMSVQDAQLVTTPIMNARFFEFEARFTAFEAKMEARFVAFEAKMEARFVAFEAKMDQKFDRLRLQLIIAIILSNVAMGPLGVALLEALKRVL